VIRKWHWFLVFALLIPLLLITVAILSNQQTAIDPLDPPDFTPTPAPSDWMTPGGGEIKYQALEPVAKQRVPVQKISLSQTQTSDFIKPTSDGGWLAVTFDRVDESDHGSQPQFILHATRFKPDGQISWDRRYDAEPFSGNGVSLCIFADDSFAVALRATHPGDADMKFEDQLVRFGPDGSFRWKTEREAVPAGGLERIFACLDGTVLAAGTIDGSGWVGSSQYPRVAAYRINTDGSVAARYMLSGVGYQALIDALYFEGTGLILLSSEETDIESSAGSIWQRHNKITCLTDGVEERWNESFDTSLIFYDLLAFTKEGGILISAAQRPDQQPTAPARPMLITIDRDGQEKWTYWGTPPTWFLSAANLTDGRLIIGQLAQGTSLNPESTIIAFHADNPEPTIVAVLPGHLTQLIPTRDGGFTAVVRQSVRQLPQPPYISSIWMDTAAVVAHYDSAFHLTWRRTIDQYKHDLRLDQIVATADDRLLAG